MSDFIAILETLFKNKSITKDAYWAILTAHEEDIKEIKEDAP